MSSYALITGASQGIGAAFARVAAQKGYNVLLVARNGNQLEENAQKIKNEFGVEAKCLALDLSLHDADKQVLQWITDNNFKVTMLINNAGYGLWGNFDELALQEQQNMLQLNMALLVNLTHRLIPHLMRNKPAYILNVASTAAYQALPTLALYSATKAFVLSFSRALHHELKPKGISVTCLSPGATKTGFVDRSKMFHMQKMSDKMGMTPEAVAKFGFDAMLSGKAEAVPGLVNKLGVLLAAIIPKNIVEKGASSMYKQK